MKWKELQEIYVSDPQTVAYACNTLYQMNCECRSYCTSVSPGGRGLPGCGLETPQESVWSHHRLRCKFPHPGHFNKQNSAQKER